MSIIEVLARSDAG
jgi:signal transduction histidine kinase